MIGVAVANVAIIGVWGITRRDVATTARPTAGASTPATPQAATPNQPNSLPPANQSGAKQKARLAETNLLIQGDGTNMIVASPEIGPALTTPAGSTPAIPASLH